MFIGSNDWLDTLKAAQPPLGGTIPARRAWLSVGVKLPLYLRKIPGVRCGDRRTMRPPAGPDPRSALPTPRARRPCRSRSEPPATSCSPEMGAFQTLEPCGKISRIAPVEDLVPCHRGFRLKTRHAGDKAQKISSHAQRFFSTA